MNKKYLQGCSDLTEYSICESLKEGNELNDTKVIKLLVYNIDYDITDEDCEENNCTKEQLLTRIPEELLIEVDYVDNDDEMDEVIADEITKRTGYLVNGYNWDLIGIYDK